MITVLAVLLLLASIVIWFRSRLTNYVKRIYKKWQGLLFLVRMMNNLAVAQKPTPVSIIVNDSDQSITVTYEKTGMGYSVFLPFNRAHVLRMNNLQMRLTMANGTSVNITQEPGIPYLCSAAELGGISITAYNIDDETSHEFGLNEKPLYCDNC
jgi:hypothetical protein